MKGGVTNGGKGCFDAGDVRMSGVKGADIFPGRDSENEGVVVRGRHCPANLFRSRIIEAWNNIKNDEVFLTLFIFFFCFGFLHWFCFVFIRS